MRGQLGGSLNAMRITDVLIDVGAAGRFTGSGSVQRGPDEKGLGTAEFALHTDRFDLKQVHGSMKPTKIAGDLKVANTKDTQTLNVNLSTPACAWWREAALPATCSPCATRACPAGKSSVRVTGNANLKDKKPFKANAVVSRFNPADFGAFPQADINAEINASGALVPQWQVAADFARASEPAVRPAAVRPRQARCGRHARARRRRHPGAGPEHGRPARRVRQAGRKTRVAVDGRQLSALRGDLYGACARERRRHRHHGGAAHHVRHRRAQPRLGGASAKTTMGPCMPAARPGCPVKKAHASSKSRPRATCGA
jgi:translocation and assembly module TamB